MINSGKTKMAALAGMALVFASVLLFMQVFPAQEGLHWVSLFFIVLGEVLPVAGFIWVEDAAGRDMGPGLRVGLYSLFFVYGVSAVSLSLALLMFRASAALLATLEIVLALAFGAILLFAAVMGNEKGKDRAKTAAAVAYMRKLEEDLYALALEPANQAYVPQLRRIEEAVKYGDHSGLTDTDAALTEKMRELKYILQDGGGDGQADGAGIGKQVDLLTEDLLRLMQARNRALYNEKKARNSYD